MATTARKPRNTTSDEAGNGKLIYTFAEGNASMRATLGGKGAGLAEMTNAGLPVPPGFTITTEACNAYYDAGKELPDGLWDDVVAHMKQLEEQTGKGFGDAANPLLVERAIGRGVQHARHDGHGPQPGAQPRDGRGPHRAHRERAVRSRCLAPLRGDVRPDRARPRCRGLRRAVRRAQGPRRRQARHRPDRRAAA